MNDFTGFGRFVLWYSMFKKVETGSGWEPVGSPFRVAILTTNFVTAQQIADTLNRAVGGGQVFPYTIDRYYGR